LIWLVTEGLAKIGLTGGNVSAEGDCDGLDVAIAEANLALLGRRIAGSARTRR
jgi:hypothetical protein